MVNQLLLACMVLTPPTSGLEHPTILAMQKESVRQRKAYGLKPQKLDKECCEIAQNWADYMAKTNSFYHGGGEQIIAVGYGTPEAAFRGWMASSGHRYWVLSRTEKCGWGAAQSESGRWYWVGAFRSSDRVINASTPEVPPPVRYVPRRKFRLFKRR
tara:strand:- start:339 stop:809 length:471 start_codon:yes stop_codon:yes gene_type:complete